MTYDRPAIFRLSTLQKTQLDWLALASGRTSSEWIRDTIEREASKTLAPNKEATHVR